MASAVVTLLAAAHLAISGATTPGGAPCWHAWARRDRNPIVHATTGADGTLRVTLDLKTTP